MLFSTNLEIFCMMSQSEAKFVYKLFATVSQINDSFARKAHIWPYVHFRACGWWWGVGGPENNFVYKKGALQKKLGTTVLGYPDREQKTMDYPL